MGKEEEQLQKPCNPPDHNPYNFKPLCLGYFRRDNTKNPRASVLKASQGGLALQLLLLKSGGCSILVHQNLLHSWLFSSSYLPNFSNSGRLPHCCEAQWESCQK